MPHANALFLPRVVDGTLPFYQARYVYDAGWNMIQMVEHPA